MVSTANLPDNPKELFNIQSFVYSSTIVVLFLSITTYGARIWCRRRMQQYVCWDDYFMGLGLFVTLLPAICLFLALQNGLGHHEANVPANQLYNFLRIQFALNRANAPALVSIKISILLFYLRLFPSRKFRVAVFVMMGFTVVWGIAAFVINLTVCTPIAFSYDKTIPGGFCKNQAITGTVNGSLSLLGDVLILFLPLPMIWRLQINMRRKVALMGIFLLGFIVCIFSAIRIVAVVNSVPTDPTYSFAYSFAWTYLEMGIAVISGNLPLLRPLFERFFRSKGETQAQLTRSSHIYAGNHSHTSSGSEQSDGNKLPIPHQFQILRDNDIEGSESQEKLSSIIAGTLSDMDTLEKGENGILVTTELTVTEEDSTHDLDSRRGSKHVAGW